MNETVTIKRREFEQLVRSAMLLDEIYEAGVDNWEGFDEAITAYSKSDPEDHYEIYLGNV